MGGSGGGSADGEGAAGQVMHRVTAPLVAPMVRVLQVRHQVTVPMVLPMVTVLLVMPWVKLLPVMLMERVVLWPDAILGSSAWVVSGRWV